MKFLLRYSGIVKMEHIFKHKWCCIGRSTLFISSSIQHQERIVL